MKTFAKLIVALVLGAAASSACVATPAVQVSAEVTPRLVWVEPGIWVVEDLPYAVYYSNGFYWRYANGVWFRSPYYNDGFTAVHVGVVPPIVVAGYRPHHVRYRAPVHSQVRPIVRDHRAPRRR